MSNFQGSVQYQGDVLTASRQTINIFTERLGRDWRRSYREREMRRFGSDGTPSPHLIANRRYG